MRGAGEGPKRVWPIAASPVEECVSELSPRPLREFLKRSLRELSKTPVEDPVKPPSEGALGTPRTWKSHLWVPAREQVGGAQPGAASQTAVWGTIKVCVLS